MKTVDLVVVGAGPAGVAAAVTAARHGLEVTLLDESPQIGGQILHRKKNVDGAILGSAAVQRGYALRQELDMLPIEVEKETIAWGIKDKRIATAGPNGTQIYDAGAVIVATGAREYVPPFPGWTLPGVMTLGGAQRLINQFGVLPGEAITIAGAGPLLWALAATILENGGHVSAILDASRPSDWLPAVSQIGALRDRAALAWRYMKVIRMNRVHYRLLRQPIRAHGEDKLLEIHAGGTSYETDTLCVGFGFRPNVELFQLAGCEMSFDRSLGGWVPLITDKLHTDKEAILAAGECAGIGGAAKALVEGELAAFYVLEALGRTPTSSDQDRLRWLQKRRQIEIRFARVLNRACETPRSYLRKIEDHTMICRCEDVRCGDVWEALQHGITTLDGLKNDLRVGQGMCQGRTCGPILQPILAEALNFPEEMLPPFRSRPPVKPVALDQLERRP